MRKENSFYKNGLEERKCGRCCPGGGLRDRCTPHAIATSSSSLESPPCRQQARRCDTRPGRKKVSRLYTVDPDADALILLPPAQGNTSTELRIKVSSKHLSLASRHFRDQLRWKWSNPIAIQPDGRVHIPLEDLDETAVIIVMNIIHRYVQLATSFINETKVITQASSRGSRVPRTLDLETLAKIAVFVDRYKCFDAVEVYVDRWIAKLQARLPTTTDDRSLILWAFVAYTFHQEEIFELATQRAILHSVGPSSVLELPVQLNFIRELDTSALPYL